MCGCFHSKHDGKRYPFFFFLFVCNERNLRLTLQISFWALFSHESNLLVSHDQKHLLHEVFITLILCDMKIDERIRKRKKLNFSSVPCARFVIKFIHYFDEILPVGRRFVTFSTQMSTKLYSFRLVEVVSFVLYAWIMRKCQSRMPTGENYRWNQRFFSVLENVWDFLGFQEFKGQWCWKF